MSARERQAHIPESVIRRMGAATAGQWAVVAALYLHADPDGLAHPSIKTLADIGGVDRRTVTRSLEQLESRIGLERMRPRPGRMTTTYRLPTRGNTPPSSDSLGGDASATRGPDAPQPGGDVSHKQGLDIHEQANSPSGGPDEPSGECPMCEGSGIRELQDEAGAWIASPCKCADGMQKAEQLKQRDKRYGR